MSSAMTKENVVAIIPASTGCPPVVFGSMPKTAGRRDGTENGPFLFGLGAHPPGKLPDGTGWQPVLPGIFAHRHVPFTAHAS